MCAPGPTVLKNALVKYSLRYVVLCYVILCARLSSEVAGSILSGTVLNVTRMEGFLWALRFFPTGMLTEWVRINTDTRPKIITCSRLLKTGCNNVVLPTLFIVVNDIVQHCATLLHPVFNNLEQVIIFGHVVN